MMPLTRGRADSAWKEKHQGTQRESEQESTGHTFRSVEAASNRRACSLFSVGLGPALLAR